MLLALPDPDLQVWLMTGDIGGPMLVQESYRWNIPVLTYGYDASFTDYFGEQGIGVVQQPTTEARRFFRANLVCRPCDPR